MKKKMLSLLLVGCMAFSLVGCNSGKTNETGKPSPTEAASQQGENAVDQGEDQQPEEDNAIDFSEEPYTISLSYPVYSAAQPDLQKIFDKVNEITLEKINAKIELKVVTIPNMANTYALAASSGEKSDLIMLLPGTRYMVPFINSKMIKSFDDELQKYGQDIIAELGDILETGKFDGKQYTVPTIDGIVLSKGVQLLKSIADENGIDPKSIKSYDDLDAVLEKVHASNPDMFTFWPTGVAFYVLNYDELGNNYGVLTNSGLDNLTLINKYEDPDWIAAVKKMREWYLKGYIPKDYATSQDQPSAVQNAGQVFTIQNTYNPSEEVFAQNPSKYAIKLSEPVKTTSNYQTFLWAIPASCERPDKVIQFLNLVFKDVELNTLLKYGIEGEHYDMVGDGVLDPAKGMQTYLQPWNLWGNILNLPVNQAQLNGASGGDIVKHNEMIKNWIASTKTSKAFGFTFDTEPVKTEISALDAICDQYVKLLEGGAVDPETEIPAFNEKLKAAGMDKVIAEKQRQLDEWAASQK